MLSFLMNVKHYYSYIIFLDSFGKAEIRKKEYLRRFDEVRNFFLMDYVDARGGYTGLIQANVMTEQELKKAIRAFESFKNDFNYGEGYFDALQGALSLVQDKKVVADGIKIAVKTVFEQSAQ